jgi:hypothetical protein
MNVRSPIIPDTLSAWALNTTGSSIIIVALGIHNAALKKLAHGKVRRTASHTHLPVTSMEVS